MTTRDNSEGNSREGIEPGKFDQSDKLMKLVVDLDERIKRIEPDIMSNNNLTNPVQANADTQNREGINTSLIHPPEAMDYDLSEDELIELGDAQEALLFLDQIRVDLSKQPHRSNTVGLSDEIFHATPGLSVGRFQIIAMIGEGGFARVFHAFDPQLEREVALKIPKPHALTSAESRHRFEREAKAAALLSHPAIVTVFEAGQAGPVHYMAAEYCPGQTLASWFEQRNRTIEVDTAVRTVTRLAEAVHHAHQRGVIHRDLKPANVLIEQPIEGSDPELELYDSVRITDFGLAKQLANDDVTLTLEGTLVGTPAYMSPEQVRCDPEIGAATDVYSLGVILHELLTGQPPHKKQSVTATIRAVETAAVPSIRKTRIETPSELDAICLKCLEKEPKSRYASAFELAEDLDRFTQGKPILAQRASAIERLSKWAKRNPVIASSLAITFLTLILGISTTYWMYRQSEIDRHTAVEATKRAVALGASETVALRLAESRLTEMHEQMDLVTGIFQELNNSSGVMDIKPELRKNILQATERIFDSDTEVDLQIDLALRMGSALTGLRFGEDGLAVISQALELARQNKSSDSKLLELKIERAFALWSADRHPEAIGALQPIIQQVEDDQRIGTQTKIKACNCLASCFRNRREFDLAKTYYKKTIELYKQAHSADTAFNSAIADAELDDVDRTFAQSWKNRSTVAFLTAGFQLAKIDFDQDPNEETLKLLVDRQRYLESVFGAADFRTVGMLVSTSLATVKLKKFDEALALAERAHKLSVEIHGEVSWQGITALNAMNISCSGMAEPALSNRYPGILSLAESSCQKFALQHGEDGVKVIGVYGNVASGYTMIGRTNEAIAIRRRLVEIAEARYGRNQEVTLKQIAGLGIDLHSAERFDEARENLEEVVSAASNDGTLKIETLPHARMMLEAIRKSKADK